MGNGHQDILQNPSVAGKLTHEEISKYGEDEDALQDDITNSDRVLTFGWEPDGFGHAGCVIVHQWKGLFFSYSSDYDPEGPFITLEVCLDEGWFRPCPNPTLDSQSLPLSMLLILAMHVVSDEGDQVVVNDQKFVLAGDNLRAIEDAV